MIPGARTIQIERKSQEPLRDKRGNLSWTTETLTMFNIKVQWGGSSRERKVDGDVVNTDITLFFKKGTTILEGDVFIVDGERYLADGKPQVWVRPPSFSHVREAVVIGANRSEN